jgi:8-oxo-dGTP diphosphatase
MNPSDHFKLIASGYLMLMQDNKILLSRRYQTGYEDGKYSLPAGHLDEHETIRACCAREIGEEIGLTISSKNLDLVHVMHRKHMDERIDFFFVAKHWNGEISNKEPAKCDDLHWFPLNALPTNTIPYIRAAIENHQKHIFYSEFGWES